MPFSSANDSVDILIRARAAGEAEIKALKAAVDGTTESEKAYGDVLKAIKSTLDANTAAVLANTTAITSQTSKVKSALKEQGDAWTDFAKSVNQAIQNPLKAAGNVAESLLKTLGPVGTGVAAVGSVLIATGSAAVGFVDKIGSAERSLLNFSLRLGLSVQQARELQFAARITGVEISTLEQSARLLGNALSDPNGAGRRQIEALQKLGVATRGTVGEERELGEVLIDVLDKMSRLPSAAERASLGQVLLGRSSKELLPLIAQYKETQEASKRFADAIGSDVNARLVEGKKAITEAGLAFDIFKAKLAAKIEPVVVTIIRKVVDATTGDNFKQKPFDNDGSNDEAAHNFAKAFSGLGSIQDANRSQMSNQSADAFTSLLKAQTEGIKNRFLDPLDQLREKLKNVKKDIEDLNQGGVVSQKDQPKFASLLGNQRDIEAQIKALEESRRVAEEATRAFQAFHERATVKEADNQIAKQIAEYENLINKFGIYGTEVQKNRALLDTLAITTDLLTKDNEKLAASFVKSALALAKQDDKVNNDDINKGLEKNLKAANAFIEAQRKIRALEQESRVKNFTQEADFQTKLIDANTRPGDEAAAEAQKYEIRLNLEKQLLQLEIEAADKENDKLKKSELLRKAALSDEERIIRVREEGELRIAEFRKKQDEEIRNNAGKVFDALTASGKDGLRNLLQSELKTIERQLFVNASSEIFRGSTAAGLGTLIPGQRDATSGKLTTIGRLLQGTPFGDKGTGVEDYTRRTAVATEKIAAAVTTSTATGAPGLTVTNGLVSIPGVSTFGSDVNGLTGVGNLIPGFGSVAGIIPGLITTGSGSGSTQTAAQRSVFSQFLGGALGLAGGANVFKAIAGGDYGVGGPGHTVTASSLGLTSPAARAGTIIGAAGTVFTGVESAIKGSSQGGAGGIASGIGSIAGTAAALDPEPISKAVLAGVSFVSDIVGSIFGNSKAKRQDAINNYITGSQNALPVSIQRDLDISGADAIYNSNGGVTAAGTTVVHNWNVQTMDAGSFSEFANNNSTPIANAVNSALLLGHPVTNTINQLSAQ